MQARREAVTGKRGGIDFAKRFHFECISVRRLADPDSHLLGQTQLSKSEAAARLVELDADETLLLQEAPYRGSPPSAAPTDPLFYRSTSSLRFMAQRERRLFRRSSTISRSSANLIRKVIASRSR